MPYTKSLLLYFKHFFALIYPDTCCACGQLLLTGETFLCDDCRVNLPKTGFENQEENRLTEIFWGKFPLETGTSLYYFQKGGNVQRLIHQFKYRGNVPLGHFLGEQLGKTMKDSTMYAAIDCILPVPLHPSKERARGFNQSEIIGRGIADILNIPIYTDLLIRKQKTSSQTKKGRFKRWENVSAVFETPLPEALQHKGILLVDDVVTTGSTLEACAGKLLENEGVRVWIATLGITAM